MRLIKSFLLAFSMYSRIPVPQFEWREEDMRYVLCFFPWVGAVIGLSLLGWAWLCQRFAVGIFCYTLVGTAIPLLVTGGFHADGFMDTMDAFHSYQERERKLEILKDSHIGAFAVITLVLYYLIYLAALSEIRNMRLLGIVSVGFVLSRALSGIGAVSFRSARKDGMLCFVSFAAARRAVLGALVLKSLICVGVMLWLCVGAGLLALAAVGAFAVCYRRRCYKQLGGITGDTAGYFVLCCELAIVIAAAVGERLVM